MNACFASAAGGVDLPLWSGIAALLFYGLLGVLVLPGLKKSLKARQRTAISRLAQAQIAERELAEQRGRHEAARENTLRETGAMLAEGRRDCAVLRESLVRNAREEIARLAARGEREAQQAAYAARTAILQAGAERAVELAGRTLRSAANPDDQRRLVDEALGQLEQRLRGNR